jgi:hypothetical protein
LFLNQNSLKYLRLKRVDHIEDVLAGELGKA